MAYSVVVGALSGLLQKRAGWGVPVAKSHCIENGGAALKTAHSLDYEHL